MKFQAQVMSRAPGRPRGRAGINRNQNRDPPAPENWQEMFYQMEARMLRAEAELQQLRQPIQQQVSEAVCSRSKYLQ